MTQRVDNMVRFLLYNASPQTQVTQGASDAFRSTRRRFSIQVHVRSLVEFRAYFRSL